MSSTAYLIQRSLGLTSHKDVQRDTTTRLLYALQPSPITFTQSPHSTHDELLPAHPSGVSALTIDKFEGRYLLSGGADSSLSIWDLETLSPDNPTVHRPLSTLPKTASAHNLGITQVSFYPFDSLAFLTSSYDHTVKLYNSETLRCSASFDLNSVVYNIALSPVASHLLVACATQSPFVRLVDLRSGSASHSLTGHSGSVLTVAWSPTREHILASGALDGTVRLWDVRRGSSSLGTLDLEDSVGVFGPHFSTRRETGQAQAHRGPVNGLVWTEDGQHIVSCGHDERIRVWDTTTGANTLANFGPMVRNSGVAGVTPLLPPSELVDSGKEVLFFPNKSEILGYELFDGTLFRRLRRPRDYIDRGVAGGGNPGSEVKDRITALAWRAHDVEMYSAHGDGSIGVWRPRTEEDAEVEEEEEREREEVEESGRKRKRGVLEDIYRDLTRRKVTFGGEGGGS
ncbi:WD40 repeat-like protein [Sporormia fimetaria CBS 119925]|uniref:WD40 repeat-like protein n=1 Tax=Sporormia fimetaria CBS 119925 TaxID=1340428 RepID=A0A6A6VIA0_9PLEO|nr:WD40 repeat-like protein [Sporormia fimetaria CBS 119925]